MPYYSDETVERVRQAVDIVDVVSQYVHLKKQGGRYVGLCPFHSEKTPSFSVNRDKQLFYCFGCGVGGDVFAFMRSYEHLDFAESVEALAERAGIPIEAREYSPDQKRRADRKSRLMEVQREAGKYYFNYLKSERGRPGQAYFIRRGLSGKTVAKFGLGYADKYSDGLYHYLNEMGYEDALLKDSGLVVFDEAKGVHDRFWNRVMFPIPDVNAKIIAFGGRVLGDAKPKYLNSPETVIFDKSRTLYGLHLAKRTREKFFILCEGYMDVIALHQAGFDNAVASLGTAFTQGHASIIRRYVSEAYLSYDSDGAGRAAALRAIPILKEAGIDAKVIHMSPYKDPDELIKAIGSDGYKERIETAENSFFFEIQCLEDNYDLRDPGGKSRFAEAVALRLLSFREEIERQNYLEAIAGKYNLKTQGLEELVRKAAGGRWRQSIQGKEAPKRRREDVRRMHGDVKSQKMLLGWISEDQELFCQVANYIGPDDFKEGILRKIASEIYATLEKGEMVQATSIVSRFEEEEEQREAASIFFEQVQGITEDRSMRQKAIQEIILHMKQQKLDILWNAVGTMNSAEAAEALKSLMKQKKELEQLKRTDFISI